MFADADHEVIDSPAALFRHLYEEHGVEEARDLDPDSAPLQFWVRRHADLERAQRASRRPPEPGRPEPEPESARQRRAASAARPAAPSTRPPERRAKAEARTAPGGAAAAARGGPGRAAPRRVRGPAGRGRWPGPWPGGALTRRSSASAVRSFATAGARPARRPSGPRSSSPCSSRPPSACSAPPARAPGRRLPRSRRPSAQPARRSAQPARVHPAGPGPFHRGRPASPAGRARARPGTGPPPRREEPVRPEAAWAVLWADLADGGRRPGDGAAAARGDDGDDLMAVADAVQARRRVRLLRR